MLIYPAIDLFEGQAVRLYKGDYAQKTVYSTDPVAVARDFVAQGAARIHLVDLEGAKSGATPNFDLVCRVKKESGAFCEIGGGIRDLATVARYLDAGLDRVILGTAAVTSPGFVEAAVAAHGDKIAVGIDVKEGNVAIHGWTQDSGLDAMQFCEKMAALGVRTVICTDISRDGAMQGTNRALYQTLQERLPLDVIASGGVSTLDDIRALAALGLHGAIVGKAYYEKAFPLSQAIEVAQ